MAMLRPIPTGIPMTDPHSLIRLQTWLSPAFPTGAFSYSSGLEAAIGNGFISTHADLTEWLTNIIQTGAGWNDAVILAEAWRVASSGGDLTNVANLSEAMSYSATRHLETMAQGSAFLLASKAWCDVTLPLDCSLPVAIGAVTGTLKIDVEQTLAAYLHAYLSNQIQAALRLMKLGQQGGVEVLVELESAILETAKRSTLSTLDDLGSSAVIADIATMQHETLSSRIFRS